MSLSLLDSAPLVAYRDCGHCEQWNYDEKTGRIRLDAAGKPVRRSKHMKPPCSTCSKVPRSVKETKHPSTITSADAISPTEQTLQAIQHYRECRAVGQFPADALVRWVAGLIREYEDWRDRQEITVRLDTLSALLGVARGR